MNVFEAIEGRRSIGKVTDVRPPRDLIEQVLEAATYAPCHHVTNPWRFVVIAGAERAAFGRVMAQSKLRRLEAEGRLTESEAERLIAKGLRAPVIIAVAAEPDPGPRIVVEEEVAATAAAVQNMLLAAHALGLGAIWRTGDAARDPDVARYLGFSENAHMVGFIYIGYPAIEKERLGRTTAANLTAWRGWSDD